MNPRTEQRSQRSGASPVATAVGLTLCIVLGLLLACNITILLKGTLDPDTPPSVLGVTPLVVLSGSMSDDRDQLDTALGNQAAWFDADTVTAGLYIVVEEDTPGKPADPEDPDLPTDPDHPDQPDTPDGGDSGGGDGYIRPQVPDTGDNSHFTAYLVLMAVSGVLLLLLLWDRWRERKCGGS